MSQTQVVFSVTSGSVNPPDQLEPSYFDFHVLPFSAPGLPPGVLGVEDPLLQYDPTAGASNFYDAYCLNLLNRITNNPNVRYLANTFDGNSSASFSEADLTVSEDQVSQVNWLLGQNFTWDGKYLGQFNFGEVQSAVWRLVGFSQAQIDSLANQFLLTNGNTQVVIQADVDFLVSAAQNAVSSGNAGLPLEAFTRVVDPIAGYAGTSTTPVYPFVDQNGDPDPRQGLIVQLDSAKLGNYVWFDCNANGIQDDDESGVNNVVVNLYDGAGQLVSSTKTGDDYSTATIETGYYQFVGLKAGQYSVEVVKPNGYSFTLQDQGGDDAKDSDANPLTGKMAVTTLTAGESDQTWDAGLITTCGVCVDLVLTNNVNSSDCNGNIRTVAQNGISAKISAFSRTDSTGEWKTAYLGSYSGGLGVTDSSESGSSPTHAVDNVGGRDNYILFEFNRAVILDQALLGWVSGDSDMQVWIGTTNDPYNNHLTLSDALLSGMFTEVNNTTSTSARWADVNGNSLAGNVIIIAASTQDTTPEDYFKVQKLDLCTPVCDRTASIGDRIWYDTNANGIQDSGEGGVAGVKIDLMDGNNNKVASTTTDSNGKYLFANLNPGDYQVNIDESSLPSGYVFTASSQGSSDQADSDIIDTATYPKAWGRMEVTTLTSGEDDRSWDAGIVKPAKACVGDRVWQDSNHNNLWDNTEAGIDNIRVKIFSLGADGIKNDPLDNKPDDDVCIGSTTTKNGGYYSFTVDAGTYYLQFDKGNVSYAGYNMSNWKWAVKDVAQNSKDSIDSDVAGDAVAKTDITTTDVFTLTPGQNDKTRDAGITPIVLDLDGNGIQTVSRADAGGRFDLFGNGTTVASGWIGSGEGFLAVDRDGNGRIDSIGELFGGTGKGAGFAKLAEYDSNGDGLVNGSDDAFAELRIWRDANGNHLTDDGELISLADAGVAELNAGYSEMPFLDLQGNLHLERSSAKMTDGRTVDMTDVYFAVATEDAAAAGVDLPDIAALLADIATTPVTDPGWLFAA